MPLLFGTRRKTIIQKSIENLDLGKSKMNGIFAGLGEIKLKKTEGVNDRSAVDTSKRSKYPVVGKEDLMSDKAHGTSATPVQNVLRWQCDNALADRICCFNRHSAEDSGYFQSTKFLEEVEKGTETTFCDSVSGKPLFIAPRGRTFEDFEKESIAHGWPSFRDEEVVWDNVRCLDNGEAVSLGGTHLGHNLPDSGGNRYCINLVSVAGQSDEPAKTVSGMQASVYTETANGLLLCLKDEGSVTHSLRFGKWVADTPQNAPFRNPGSF
jgi:peptide methionine sulfoxide reductase MsrB